MTTDPRLMGAPARGSVRGDNGAPVDDFIYETRDDIPRDIPSMQWAPFDIPAILRVLRTMPLDERGFFCTALFVMYEFMEPLPVDPDDARARVGIDIRSYKHHLQKALKRGVLKTRPTGRISNSRFEEEITKWVAGRIEKAKSPARQQAALEREAKKRVELARIAADLAKKLSENNAGQAQTSAQSEVGREAQPQIDRNEIAATSDRSRGDLAAISDRSHGDLSEKPNHINDAAHPSTTPPAQQWCTEKEIERESKNPHTHTGSVDRPRESSPAGDGVCVVESDPSQIAMPPRGRITTDQPPPPELVPLEGEVAIGPGVFVSDTFVRHRYFKISLPALTMQLTLANQGWSTAECKDLAKKFACAHALQWAAQIDNGHLSRDVLPYEPVLAIRASIVKQRQRNEALKAKGSSNRMSRFGRG